MDNQILRNSVISGLLFGTFLGLLSWNWVIFLVAGVLFGATMGIFAYFVARKAGWIKKQLFKNEKVIKRGLANHFVNAEGVGGILFLTDKQLLHKPHAINFQRAIAAYQLKNILSAETSLTKNIIPNGLKVIVEDGHTEKFVVNGRKKWAKAINKQLKNMPH
jgi:hypothetical protein